MNFSFLTSSQSFENGTGNLTLHNKHNICIDDVIFVSLNAK